MICRSKSTLSKFGEWYRSFWHPQAQAPPYKHVCQLGDPVLRRKAEEVDLTELRKSPARIMKIIANMRAVSLHYRAVGISAPQIGVPLRIIMIEFPEKNKKYFPAEVYAAREMATIPLKVFINPRMDVTNYQKILHPEACESIKGLSAVVPRYQAVTINGYNEKGEPVTWQASGWAARIIQHEMDHLDGRMYTDVMESQSLQVDDWYRINARAGNYYLYYKQRY